jgi:hypothetical protein
MHKAVKLGLGILLFATAVAAQPSAPEAPSLPETTTETSAAATEAVNSPSIVRAEAVPAGDFIQPSHPEASELSPAPHASPYDGVGYGGLRPP